MRDFKIPSSSCPNCGHIHNGALAANSDVPPKPGDFTICMDCRAVSVYDADMSLKEPSEADLLDMPLVDIARAQKALKDVMEA